MVNVTERATRALLERRRTANVVEAEAGLRVRLDPTGRWVLIPDRAREDDEVLRHEGTPLLLVDPGAQQALAGATVDCQVTPGGRAELVLRRPQPRN